MKRQICVLMMTACCMAGGLRAGAEPATVTIGALLSLTGEGASVGISSQAALLEASDAANLRLAQRNAPFRIRLQVEDTETQPVKALKLLQDMYEEQGVRLVIGPSNSGEVLAVKEFADQHGVLVLSDGSTAPSLALDDNVLRFIPDDTHQAEAMAMMMQHHGVRTVLPIWRGDLYGEELVEETARHFRAMGGEWLGGIRYEPDSTDHEETIQRAVNALNTAPAGRDRIAIYLVAFDEVVPLFEAAARVPALGRLRWYGCDATARLPSLSAAGPAGKFAARIRFMSPIQTDEVAGSEYDSSLAAVKARVTERAGVQPSPYAYAAWDAFWVALFAIEREYPILDAAPMKQAVIEVASAYQGVVGPGMLNKAGDREFGKYVFLEVQPHGKSFQWVSQATGHFQPMFPPYLTFE